ncbi:hypothetical protein HNO52_02090 [Billgrantia diversa]|uniref:hypothetical protein n=1 Tax=Halomonas sp. MCCC 1A13316 TaxID=2733487 RepID=UPI0018A4365D|nr:hypothetical protein [Halomonas sp. MCCC 1A13316]QOR37436.1 hypothetical protein HNO52_02090 [Halomonas sp. MCCC 1A13316]
MIKRIIRAWGREDKRKLPDVVLHIGAPKSGSSAIQRFCQTNREALAEWGYYYPEHSLDRNGVSGGHTQLAGALLNGKQAQAEQRLSEWLQHARESGLCLLLSAEALYGKVAEMHAITRELDVRVIGFLRHPVDYLLGNHNQGIKRHMGTQRLNEQLPTLLSQPTQHLVGLPLLKWADAFGDEYCAFLPYRSPRQGGESIEQRFLQVLGIPEAEAVRLVGDVAITNRSYVKSALELKRLLNTVLPELPDSLAHRVDWSLQGYSDRAEGEQGYTMADLSQEVRERLEHHLLQQMTPVVTRFPALREVAESPAVSVDREVGAWLDLAAPLTALEKDAPDILIQVRGTAVAHRDSGRGDYAFCKLLDVLGIEFNEPCAQAKFPGLSAQQRTVLEKETSREADFLRELAVLLERQGLLEDALFAIERAQAWRPKGPGIQNIKARIEERLSMQRAVASPRPRQAPEAES